MSRAPIRQFPGGRPDTGNKVGKSGELRARALTAEDVEIWRALRTEGIALFPASFLPTAEEAAQVSVEADRRALSGGGRFAVFRGGEAVGIAALRREVFQRMRHRASVGPFYVKPDAQGSGAADALMVAVTVRAREIGVTQLELSVAADNPRAIAFYTRHGFNEVARFPNAVILDGVPQDDLVFVRELGAPGAHS